MTRFGREGGLSLSGGTHEYAMWDGAYVLGALSSAERRAYETHLGTCPSCRKAVGELGGMPALLAQLDRDVVASIDEGGRGAAGQETPRQRRRRDPDGPNRHYTNHFCRCGLRLDGLRRIRVRVHPRWPRRLWTMQLPAAGWASPAPKRSTPITTRTLPPQRRVRGRCTDDAGTCSGDYADGPRMHEGHADFVHPGGAAALAKSDERLAAVVIPQLS